MSSRRTTRKPITLVVDYEGAEDMCRDYTHNLSTGGVFIHTDRNLAIGDSVRLQLSFPRLLQPLSITGVVRWVRQVSDGDSGVGIEFVNFDEGVRPELDEFVQRILDRDPKMVEPSLRVLLVEDNPHVARLIEEGLTRSNSLGISFDFEHASNGQEALDLLLGGHFDLLVIDVNLPVIDGPSVIERIRLEQRYSDLPIVAVSAGGRSAGEEAISAGADFFLEKPMRLRQIVDTMKSLFVDASDD